MPNQTRTPIAPSCMPEKLRIRLARYIRRRLLWVVPFAPWELDGLLMPIPIWVRHRFATDPDNAQTVESDVELAVNKAPVFPPTEGQQWCWLKRVAYCIALELANREVRHLVGLQPPEDEETETTWESAIPSSVSSPEAVVVARELLVLSAEVWGDSEYDRRLLEAVLGCDEANSQESPEEAGRRRRNTSYRRKKLWEMLDDLEVARLAA